MMGISAAPALMSPALVWQIGFHTKKALLKNMLTFVTVMLSRFYDDGILTGFEVDSLLMTRQPVTFSCCVQWD